MEMLPSVFSFNNKTYDAKPINKARYKLEAIKLLPTISSYGSKDFSRLTELYELVKNHKVGCTPCMYYAILNYFNGIKRNIPKYKGRKKLKPIKRFS